jgi:HEAT repeat protein/cellulose biosynthesis protein BcsQ
MADGTLITFYSYKGGVGRTFTLANVAVALANWGYRVLAIDWDLDAPGLAHYFAGYLQDRKKGLIELVTRSAGKRVPHWHDFLSPVTLPEERRLDLITAGHQDGTYIDRVQALRWAEAYEQHGLAERLEAWRRDWKEAYDFVLIDSRTGVTDIGAICTAHLPDILVALFTANHQSVDGCMTVVERAQKARQDLPYDRTALLVLPVVSRFDAREEYQRAEEWRPILAQKVAGCYTAWADRDIEPLQLLSRTTIPYVAYWSFGEGLPVLSETVRSTDSIRFFLETIAGLLAHRLGNTTRLLESAETYIEAAARAGRRTDEFSWDVFLGSTPDLSSQANTLASALADRGFRVVLPAGESEAAADFANTVQTALDQSRHAVFLLGREYGRWIDMEMRSFLRQALDESSDRLILPVLMQPEFPSDVPGMIRQLVVLMGQDLSLDALADRLAQHLRPNPTTEPHPSAQLDTADPLTRLAAVRVVGRLGNDEQFERLLPRLSDDDPRVRDEALQAVQAIHERSRARQRLVGQVRQLAEAPDSGMQMVAAELLLALGDRSCTPVLLRLLSARDAGIRVRAARALGQSGEPAAIDWLGVRLSDEDAGVRGAAAAALARFDDERALDELLRAAAGTSNRETQRMIERTTVLSAYRDRVGALISRIHQPELREVALDVLSLSPLGPQVAEQLVHLMDDPDPGVRHSIVRALGSIGGREAWEGLVRGADDPDPSVRAAALHGLGKSDDSVAVNTALAHARDEEPEVREACAEALGRLPLTGGMRGLVRETLEPMMDDPVREVRQAALGAIVKRDDLDGEQRRLASRDLDGLPPWLDPWEAIAEERVEWIAAGLRLPVDQVLLRFQELSDSLGGRLKFAWEEQRARR